MLKNKKIIVTGGAGFIGSNIVMALQNDNSITVIDDFTMGATDVESLFNANVKLVKIDASTPVIHNKIDWEGTDYIFHFGSISSGELFRADPHHLTRKIGSLVNMMEIARKTRATVVYPSSGSIYGGALFGTALKEDSMPRPSNLYSIGKLSSEMIADYYRTVHSVKSVGIRIFAGYGDREEYKGDKGSAVTLFLLPMMRGESPEVWGDGSQTRDLVYVKDVVDMAIKCAENPKVKVVNVGSGEAISFKELIQVINECLGTNIEPKYIPKDSTYPVYHYAPKLDNTLADISLAKKEYGFKPTTIKDGLNRYINYLNSKGG